MDRLALGISWLAVERDLGEIPIRERPSLDRSEGCVLLLQAFECFLDLLVRNRDLRLFRSQFFVAFYSDCRQHFEACLEAQRITLLNVEVSDSRLRNRR